MKKNWILAAAAGFALVSCDPEEEVNDVVSDLDIPTSYVSANYEANVATESTVMDELSQLGSDVGDAESNAQSTTVSAISYPSNLSSVTLPSYKALVDGWLVELVKAANDDDGFQIPSNDSIADGEEGGLLGSRLLDENGLELEQMIDKGSYGAALYNHAVSLVNSELTAADVDKLVEIFGTDASFNADEAGGPAKYAKRRSDNTGETGFFYDIKTNLITAKAAIAGGEDYHDTKHEALDAYLLNWEKSNFATVINYCYGAKSKIQEASTMADGEAKDALLGDAMHAYAEGVGFAHGFKGVDEKLISDAQIDAILTLLNAPEGETPTSYKFLTEASTLANLDQIITDIQDIYGFTDAEVVSFYVNN